MQLIRKHFQTYLTTGDEVQLARIERDLNFETLLALDGVPRFGIIGKEAERKAMKHISQLTARFLATNYPDAASQEVAVQFAMDLFETRPDWTMYDVIYFFKFIRQRQDLDDTKIFGNAFKMTPIILNRMVAIYEEHRAEAREQLLKKQSGEQENGRLMIGAGEQKLDERFRKLAEELSEKFERKEDWFARARETNKFLRDLEENWKQIMARVDAGEITNEQAAQDHFEYRKNYGK